MLDKKTPVSKFMTSHPHSIGIDQTLATAHTLMQKHAVRHLPVLDGGHVVGLVSMRDLHLVETLPDVDTEKISVEEAMTPEPYTVPPTKPLGALAQEMAEHKYGSAIIVDGAKVVGVFTTTDALRALHEALT